LKKYCYKEEVPSKERETTERRRRCQTCELTRWKLQNCCGGLLDSGPTHYKGERGPNEEFIRRKAKRKKEDVLATQRIQKEPKS